MSVRCKFVCDAVIKTWSGYDYVWEIKFSPVTHGSPENEKFFKFTPYGQFSFGSVGQHDFEPGKEYYLDISDVMRMVELV